MAIQLREVTWGIKITSALDFINVLIQGFYMFAVIRPISWNFPLNEKLKQISVGWQNKKAGKSCVYSAISWLLILCEQPKASFQFLKWTWFSDSQRSQSPDYEHRPVTLWELDVHKLLFSSLCYAFAFLTGLNWYSFSASLTKCRKISKSGITSMWIPFSVPPKLIQCPNALCFSKWGGGNIGGLLLLGVWCWLVGFSCSMGTITFILTE